MPVGYPLTAGNRFDASSIELVLNGKRYIGCTALEYRQSLTPGVVRGLSAQPLGYTRGIYDAGGRLTMLREEFQDLSTDLVALSLGFLEARFMGQVTYSELPPSASGAGLPTTTSIDTIWFLRFTEDEHQINAGSSDPLTVSMQFVCMFILVNGIAPMNNILKNAVAATIA